jgi:SOS-response transcriptional repressor LexA
MTRIQKKYYEAIRSLLEHHKRSPSFEEIATLVGVRSLASVHRAVHKLIDQGYVINEPGRKYMNLAIVPQKMHSMNSCNRQHPPIWYLSAQCPLCDVLQRKISTGKAEAVAL